MVFDSALRIRSAFCNATGFCSSQAQTPPPPEERKPAEESSFLSDEVTACLGMLGIGAAVTAAAAYILSRPQGKKAEADQSGPAAVNRMLREALHAVETGTESTWKWQVVPDVSRQLRDQGVPSLAELAAQGIVDDAPSFHHWLIHRQLVESGKLNLPVDEAARNQQAKLINHLYRLFSPSDLQLLTKWGAHGDQRSANAMVRDAYLRSLQQANFDTPGLDCPYTSYVRRGLITLDEPVLAAPPADGRPLEPAAADPSADAVRSGAAVYVERAAAARPEEIAVNGAARALEGTGAEVPSVRGTSATGTPRIASATEGATPKGLPGGVKGRLPGGK